MKFRAFTPWKKRNREFSLSNYEPSLGKISIFTDTALSSIKKEPSQAETLQEEVTIDELQNEVRCILLIFSLKDELQSLIKWSLGKKSRSIRKYLLINDFFRN
jgi:hypothetical protein